MTVAHQRFTIRGEVDSPSFPPWIERHSRRLGLSLTAARLHAGAMELVVAGHPDLLDALEVGCSLGPIDVLVDIIERESLEAPA